MSWEEEETMQEPNWEKHVQPEVVPVLRRHLLSYLGCRRERHLIPVTSLTPTHPFGH